MANANLFQQYLQPVRSVTDYAADLDKAEGNQIALQGQRRQNELAALTADQARQKIASDTEDRNALQRLAATWGSDTTLDQRVASLRNSGRSSLMQQADALEKQGLEKQKVGAEVGEKQSKVMDETIKRYRTALDYVSTPQDAARWLQAQYSDPAISEHMTRLSPFEQAVARIPSDPQQFQQWRQQAGMGMEKFAENQRLLAQQAETERNNKAQVAATYAGIDERRESSKRTDKRERELNGTKGNATEDERKAAGWFAQADNAWSNMQKAMGGVDPKTGKFKREDVARPGFPDVVAAIPSFGIGEAIGNTIRSPERQQFNQASSSLSEALLRAATGAGVNRDEAVQKIRELTPVFGEDSATTKQKMDSIPMYLNSLKQRAGRAMPQSGGGGVVDFGSLK